MRDNTLYLIWRNPVSRAQYRIGELGFVDGRYRFRYDPESLELAEAGGFSLKVSPLYPTLPDVDKIYESPEMPSVFVHRLPDPNRHDYADLLARRGLSPGAHPFEVLRVMRGRLATDQLFFEEAPGPTREGGARFICFIAGWRYHSGEALLPRLLVGDRVYLIPEQSNPYDPFATMVISKSGHKLGYLPAFYSEVVARAFPEGRPVEASIIELSSAPAAAEERVKLEVVIGPPGEQDLSDEEINAKAIGKLRSGLLPRKLPHALGRIGSEDVTPVLIGSGKGKVCSVCDRVIGSSHELATEIRYTDQRKFVFHHRCFDAWGQMRHSEASEVAAGGTRSGGTMMRTEEVVVIFVASPADLEAERNRLEEVVHELNAAWSRTLGVRLELVRWETYAHPGIGDDPQQVVRRQLPSNYQIFLGLMWGRYGTPTGRAGSGTEEEFQEALNRFRKAPGSVGIMFYFKDAPLPPSQLDPDQLGKIQRFRASLGGEGVLYWTFVSLEEFERLVRLHLTREIQELLAKSDRATDQDVPVPERATTTDDDQEEGFLDLLDAVGTYFGGLVEITGRIAGETKSLGDRIEERTKEIQAAGGRVGEQVSRAEMRAIFEKAAMDMNQYVARVRTELPLFRESLQRGADATARAALMTLEFDSGEGRLARDARTALTALDRSLAEAFAAAQRFRDSVQGLPRMTVVLNRAKRETADVLAEVLDGMGAGRRVVAEAGKALDALLAPQQRPT